MCCYTFILYHDGICFLVCCADNAASLPRKSASGPSQLKHLFEETPCLEVARNRDDPVAIRGDSQEVLAHAVS